MATPAKSKSISERIRHRLSVWRWRVRYWWLDTEWGADAQAATLALSSMVFIAQVVRMTIAGLYHPPVPKEQLAPWPWWVIQLVIALVAAAVSYALRPKIPKQPDPKQESPTVEDGLCVDDHFGEVWVDDPPVLAWKVVRVENIKSKSKK